MSVCDEKFFVRMSNQVMDGNGVMICLQSRQSQFTDGNTLIRTSVLNDALGMGMK